LKTRLQASIPLPQQLPLRGRLSEAQAYQAQKALEQAIHDHRTIPRNELCLHETRLIVVPYVLRIAANHGVTSGPDNARIDSQIFLTNISHGDGHDLPVLRVQHNWSSSKLSIPKAIRHDVWIDKDGILSVYCHLEPRSPCRGRNDMTGTVIVGCGIERNQTSVCPSLACSNLQTICRDE